MAEEYTPWETVGEYDDMGFGTTIRYRFRADDPDMARCILYVEVYRVVSVQPDPDGDVRYYETPDLVDQTTDLDSSVPEISGYIKWDGCANLELGDHHFCGLRDAEQYARALVSLWHLAARVLPAYDVGIAGLGSG